jgi:single-stranded-DNA-specific exonuclease
MKWVLVESDDAVTSALSEGAGLHPLIARLMVNRGITGVEAARSFLACDLSTLSSPWIFSGMAKAAARIRDAITGNEKIAIYGDYDVDGVTGTSLLYLVLKGMGARMECYIPDRITEGYGLNARALETIRASGTKLVISVDCGITAFQEAELARSLGLDLVITDHHEIKSSSRLDGSNGFVLPDAFAVLHPWLLCDDVALEVRNQVSGLTGVGIAFKLAQAFLDVRADDEHIKPFLDLVAMGTVADVGKITGENRILVKHGLDILSGDSEKLRPGMAALKQVTCLDTKKIGVGTVGFSLAPRINASGRLEHADTAFRLMTTDSREEAAELASVLDTVNRERQAVEERIWADARLHCRQLDLDSAGALVLASDEWHPGVIGIVASRIVEEFYRPTALICLNNGMGKGSARSIPGFDLYEGLASCSDLLIGFGGHKYAAGFTIAKENISQFRERLGSLVLERVGAQGFVRTLSVDRGITFGELDMDLVQEMEKLAPFGQGNPEPKLGARDIEVISSRIVGNNHLKLRLRQPGGVTLDAIAFKRGHLLGKQVRDGVQLAGVFTPRLNTWNGKTTVELEIKDMRTEKENSKLQNSNTK